MLLDEEVFAVILAVTIVASVVGVATVLRPENPEPFTAIGLLDSECKIGEYPETVLNDSYVDLCIFVLNHLGRPAYFKVVYKIADNETLPSNTTESSMPPLTEWRLVLDHGENTTFPVKVWVYTNEYYSRRALVFELWMYDPGSNKWVYTGRWVHLYVNITA